MKFENSYHVRAATVEDRQDLANLIHFETHVQRHLEWRSALDWLGASPYNVLEKNGKLVAALACPPEPPQVSWIRLFAVSSNVSPENAWKALWSTIEDEMKHSGVQRIVSIPLYNWFRNLLENGDFTLIEKVLVLAWSSGTVLPPEQLSTSINIRFMNKEDLDSIEAVDQAAFTPIWQTPRFTLEGAFTQAAIATVVEIADEIVGYQISTTTSRGGHLARLAVHPEFQGQGIGYALVRDVLLRFIERGAQSVTVNTQKNNLSSLAIYKKAGFLMTGEDYPVYEFMIK
ncbi:MAG: GNAT family N-acetyltransferase [Anaerolineales bacterium]|nr:GNAT family N-acetyltransferase [Anaerolineales bacterium]